MVGTQLDKCIRVEESSCSLPVYSSLFIDISTILILKINTLIRRAQYSVCGGGGGEVGEHSTLVSGRYSNRFAFTVSALIRHQHSMTVITGTGSVQTRMLYVNRLLVSTLVPSKSCSTSRQNKLYDITLCRILHVLYNRLESYTYSRINTYIQKWIHAGLHLRYSGRFCFRTLWTGS